MRRPVRNTVHACVLLSSYDIPLDLHSAAHCARPFRKNGFNESCAALFANSTPQGVCTVPCAALCTALARCSAHLIAQRCAPHDRENPPSLECCLHTGGAPQDQSVGRSTWCNGAAAPEQRCSAGLLDAWRKNIIMISGTWLMAENPDWVGVPS